MDELHPYTIIHSQKSKIKTRFQFVLIFNYPISFRIVIFVSNNSSFLLNLQYKTLKNSLENSDPLKAVTCSTVPIVTHYSLFKFKFMLVLFWYLTNRWTSLNKIKRQIK